MEPTLTRQDFDDLIDAVGAWEHQESADRMVSLMLAASLAPTREAREKIVAEDKAEHLTARGGRRLRKDRSILLRAKLIMIRDGLEAQQVLDGTKGGG